MADKALEPSVLLSSSLAFGSCSGCLGLGFGSLVGVIRSKHPLLFALLSGGQWFVLGTTYWFSRSLILDIQSGQGRRQASVFAGAFSGATVAAVTRGRRNVLPAAFMFGLFGYAGQAVYERFDASHVARMDRQHDSGGFTQSVMTSIGKSKWSPIRLLDDDEYAQMMQDKILRLDAELALIEEDITELRKVTQVARK